MAGSLFASYLARRCGEQRRPLAQFFTDLMREIETARRTLEQIAACTDAQASPRKQAGFGSVAKHLVPEAADRTIHLILAKYMADDDDR